MTRRALEISPRDRTRGLLAAGLAALSAGCGDPAGTAVDADVSEVAAPDVDAAGDVATDATDATEGLDAADDGGDAAPDTLDAPDLGDPSDAPDPGDAGDASDVPTWVAPPDRAPGARAPRTARCDDAEPARCFLPWPSNAFVTADATTATGLRVTLADDVLPDDEGVSLVEGADGFSRVSPIVVALPLGVDPAGVALRVFVAEPGAAQGREVALRPIVFPGRDGFDPPVLVGYPLAPMVPASEHLAVVTGLAPTRAAELALGRVAPASQADADLVAYHAPARALLAAAGVDPARVGRLWDFTTRSVDDPLDPLRARAAACKAAVDAGQATVTIDAMTPGPGGSDPIAMVVEGHLADLPDARVAGGVYAVPFRIVVPVGSGDYHVILYGHGAGGNVHDASFDALIAGNGAAKVGIEVDGWTDATMPDAVAGLLVPIPGTAAVVGRMGRALAGIAAIHEALGGPLGDALAAATISGQANPAAGRRPRGDHPIWAGGSLGGVTGFVYGHLEPKMVGGLLNVPGAGFTHWLGQSSLSELLDLALVSRYPAMLDQQLAAAMTQGIWDEVDGSVWAGTRTPAPVFLVQMSVGDPVMPNLATALVATSLGAVMLAPDGATPLVPVPGLEQASSVSGRSALTEFATDGDSALSIHGFAARNTPAGEAARSQLAAFIAGLWVDDPVVTIPDACLALDPPGICDFRAGP